MSRRLRVLFLSDHLGHSGGVIHGATRYFLTVLPRIDPALFELSVCFLDKRHPAAAELEARGIQPIFLSRAKWDARALFDLNHLMREREVQLVHAAGMKGIFFGRIAAHMNRAACLIHLHDMHPLGKVMGPLQRRIARWTDHALAVSQAVAHFAVETFALSPELVQVLHNGIVTEDFADPGPAVRLRVREELNIASTDAVIGIVGGLLPVKGHAALLRALPAVRERCPHVRLLIVGEGPERAACEQLVRELELHDPVIFTGHRDDVPRLLAAMDIVTMPSLHEGLPYAALEALAAGKPVVASDVGGIPEIITSGVNGLLVPPTDPAALATALLDAITPGAMRDRLIAGAVRTGQEHDIAAHVHALQQLYVTLGGHRVDQSVDACVGSLSG